MPINPKQFIGRMKQRSAAVKNLKQTAQSSQLNTANAFGRYGSQSPQGQAAHNSNNNAVGFAAAGAKTAGVKQAKINKVLNKSYNKNASFAKKVYGSGRTLGANDKIRAAGLK